MGLHLAFVPLLFAKPPQTYWPTTPMQNGIVDCQNTALVLLETRVWLPMLSQDPWIITIAEKLLKLADTDFNE